MNAKRTIILFLGLLLAVACTTERRYTRPPTPLGKRLIVLPRERKTGTYRPYVVNGQRYYPLSDSEGFVQYGKASWYGKKFHGRPTASGERFDMYTESAAHKTLPMGTYVMVRNLDNNRQTVVRINDRGPFVKGRIIDLSYAAARKIGLIGPGTARVKIVAMGRQVARMKTPQGVKTVVEISNFRVGAFAVQVGAFRERRNALRLADRLKVIFAHVDIAVSGAGKGERLYKVRVAKTDSLKKAGEIEKKLEAMGFDSAFVVRL